MRNTSSTGTGAWSTGSESTCTDVHPGARQENEAVAIGSSTISGLAAAVWTRDVKKAIRPATALKAGTVRVNNVYDPGLPSATTRNSTSFESGRHAWEEYNPFQGCLAPSEPAPGLASHSHDNSSWKVSARSFTI
ncbi:MAG: aldehyde dehydrogenase family protein [Acidobacteriota bacterium]